LIVINIKNLIILSKLGSLINLYSKSFNASRPNKSAVDIMELGTTPIVVIIQLSHQRFRSITSSTMSFELLILRNLLHTKSRPRTRISSSGMLFFNFNWTHGVYPGYARCIDIILNLEIYYSLEFIARFTFRIDKVDPIILNFGSI